MISAEQKAFKVGEYRVCKLCTKPLNGGKKFCSNNCVALYNHMRRRKSLNERFFCKIRKDDDCWIWVGATNSSGYGSFYIGKNKNGKPIIDNAARVSWRIHFSSIPNGSHVLHKCDVRNCVNPEHLFLGSNADNVQDRVEKGRSGSSAKFGVRHHNPKLNNLYVREIRVMVKYGYPHRKIANLFMVSRQAIGKIINNQIWRDVK